MDYSKLLKQFEKYFKISKYFNGKGDLPSDATAIEISRHSTNYNYLQRYIERFLIFPSDEATDLFKLIQSDISSLKSTLGHFNINNDILTLEQDSIDNLLLSFGFNYLELPLDTKKRILYVLVSSYKIKGSINSIGKIVESWFSNFSIHELWLQKISDSYLIDGEILVKVADYVFEWTKQKTIPGSTHNITTQIPYEDIIDKHWWQDKQSIIDEDIKRTMSPFFVVEKEIDLTSAAKSIALFKYYVYKDYQKLQNDPTTYPENRVLNIASLPDSFSFLELWYMIRYFWVYLNYYNIVDDVGRNWFHKDYETVLREVLLEEYQEQFEVRYQQSFSESIVSQRETHVGFTYIHVAVNKINKNEIYRYINNNRKEAVIYPTENKIVVAFGKDQDNKPIYKIHILAIDQNNEVEVTEIDTHFWLENPICFTYGNWIVFSYGKYENGELNNKVYIIDKENKVSYTSRFMTSTLVFDRIDQQYFNNINKTTIICGSKNNELYAYESYAADKFPYRIVKFNLDDNYKIKYISHNTSSVILFVAYTSTGEFSENRYYLYDQKTKTSLELSIPYSELISTDELYILPFGSGFFFIIYDKPNNQVRQYVLSIDENDITNYNIETYISYDDDKPFNFDTTLIEDRFDNYVVTPHFMLAYKTSPDIDIVYYMKQIKEDKMKYVERIIDYTCVSESARCFRELMLLKRENNLVLEDSVLPKFGSVPELRNFLMSLIPNNITTFETSPTKELILLELLLLTSRLFGFDSTGILASYLSKTMYSILDRFKPIYSRPIFASMNIFQVDPIGDWIAMAQEVRRQILKSIHEKTKITDENTFKLRKTLEDNIDLHDIITLVVETNFYIDLIGKGMVEEGHTYLATGGESVLTLYTNTIRQYYTTTTTDIVV